MSKERFTIQQMQDEYGFSQMIATGSSARVSITYFGGISDIGHITVDNGSGMANSDHIADMNDVTRVIQRLAAIQWLDAVSKAALLRFLAYIKEAGKTSRDLFDTFDVSNRYERENAAVRFMFTKKDARTAGVVLSVLVPESATPSQAWAAALRAVNPAASRIPRVRL